MIKHKLIIPVPLFVRVVAAFMLIADRDFFMGGTVMEEWRVIKDFPDHAVSDMGRVKRIQTSANNVNKAGSFLNGSISPDGYIIFDLRNNGKRRSALAHHLVLESFVGPCPKGLQCNHKDGKKQNNRVINLEWVTHSENQRHAFMNGLKHGMKGEKNPASKLKNNEVWLIKKLLASGMAKQKLMAKLFKITPESISGINRGKSWNYIKYP